MIDDSCESCISQFHKNLRLIASDNVVVLMLIIDYRRYLVVLLGIGIVLYEVVVFELIFKLVQLYYPVKTMSVTNVQVFESVVFRRQSFNYKVK